MNKEQSDRYELFSRFYEIQRAIDRIKKENKPEMQDAKNKKRSLSLGWKPGKLLRVPEGQQEVPASAALHPSKYSTCGG